MNFDIPDLTAKIEENLKKMEEFYYETYRGFYCGICNYQNQKYIDPKKKEIVFSEKFCRDIVENSLANLVLYHVHYNKYANLISKFLSSCDYKGDYQADVAVDKKYIFVGDIDQTN